MFSQIASFVITSHRYHVLRWPPLSLRVSLRTQHRQCFLEVVNRGVHVLVRQRGHRELGVHLRICDGGYAYVIRVVVWRRKIWRSVSVYDVWRRGWMAVGGVRWHGRRRCAIPHDADHRGGRLHGGGDVDARDVDVRRHVGRVRNSRSSNTREGVAHTICCADVLSSLRGQLGARRPRV